LGDRAGEDPTSVPLKISAAPALPLRSSWKRGGFVRDRQGNPVDQRTATIEQLIESGVRFAHDSLLEEAVCCELVSEVKNSGFRAGFG
jgi:hypothetical protein